MQRPRYIPRYNPPVSPSRPRNPSSFFYSSWTSSASTVTSEVNNQRPASESAPSPERKVTSHACLPILFWWRQRKRPAHFSDKPAEDPQVHLARLKRFSLPQLQVATNNFSREHILGEGGFGEVYKGQLADGSLIAVKRVNESSRIKVAHFHIGVKTIHMAVHQNLLRLHGYCMTPAELFLVYPYMANGSVASCLRDQSTNKPPLDWPTRRRIALGSARGLSYLHEHCDPEITHHDVRAQNVLLDEDFEAVVGDFGLANFIAYNGLRTRAPEYKITGTSSKTDVFDYGIVLLELLLGQRNSLRLGYDREVFDRVIRLLDQRRFDKLVDPDLLDYDVAQVESHIQVGLLCTREHPLQRPKMSEVLRMLESDGLANRSDWWSGSRKDSQNEKAWSRLLR